MKDSALRLQDKTVLLAGPFNGITQTIMRTLTEFGADVGYVFDQSAQPGKFTDGLNESREVHPHFGRAHHIQLPMTNDVQIQEALGRVVGAVGRMDALIDASPLSWNASTDPQSAMQLCLNLAEKIIPFLLAKQRGRIVYLVEDPCLDGLRESAIGLACREVLDSMIGGLAKQYRTQNVSVNILSLGLTDDFVIRTFPKINSVKRAFEELAKTHPGAKLVDYNDVGLGAAYLASGLSASLTGQTLRLTHGFHI